MLAESLVKVYGGYVNASDAYESTNKVSSSASGYPPSLALARSPCMTSIASCRRFVQPLTQRPVTLAS
jgi:hypothetical protein